MFTEDKNENQSLIFSPLIFHLPIYIYSIAANIVLSALSSHTTTLCSSCILHLMPICQTIYPKNLFTARPKDLKSQIILGSACTGYVLKQLYWSPKWFYYQCLHRELTQWTWSQKSAVFLRYEYKKTERVFIKILYYAKRLLWHIVSSLNSHNLIKKIDNESWISNIANLVVPKR